jgi:capsid protein
MDAADTLDRLRAARTPPEIGPEKETELHRAKCTAVARQLDRNNSWAAGVFRSITDNVVGEGISPESAVVDRTGSLRTQLNQKLEYQWERWAEHADVTGKRSYYELEAQSEKELWRM